MDPIRKIIAEEVSRIFEDEDSMDPEKLRKELKFARHYLDILDQEAFQARQIVFKIQDKIDSDRSSMDCQQLLDAILQMTYQMKM